MLVLEVQRKSKTSPPQLLETLLAEVDEKIKKDSNIRRKAEFKEAILADSLSALQGSEKIGTSELSSAAQSEIDELSSLNDNSSLFVGNPVLSLSPSLTPLYEDKERNQGTQTDSTSALPVSSIESIQRRCMSVSDKSDGLRSSSSLGSSPPPRAMSVGVSSTHHKKRTGVLGYTTGKRGVHPSAEVLCSAVPSETNVDDQVGSLDQGGRFPKYRKKPTRPKSAPVIRPDTLEMMMESNRVVHSGDSTLPRRTVIHPPISPSDPLSLSARVNHLSGRPQPIPPPAFSTLYTSRNVPHFTVHSRPLSSLPGLAISEYCMPTSCLTNNESEEGDPTKESDVRLRTWTEPQKNFRDRQEVVSGNQKSQKILKIGKESGHSSLPRRLRMKSSSSQYQSYNTMDTHSTISSHSSCGRSTVSMGSSSGQNTPRVAPSTPTFPRDVIDHEPIIHINPVISENESDKLVLVRFF